MIRLARLSIRRPLAALVASLAVVTALALVGLGVTSSLSPSVTTIPGTESSHAQHLAEAEFGPSTLVPILLEGPSDQLDRQGPALVRQLAKRDDTRVLSAWDAGDTDKWMRPNPKAALIIASVAESEKTMVNTDQAQIEKTVDSTVSNPVKASVSGQPSIDRALKDEAIDTTKRSVAIALPILFIVLLLVLRAPFAALGITVLAAATSLAGLGVTAIFGKFMDVDPIAVTLGTLDGLVVGAAYGVLIYRRWNSAMGTHHHHADAAHAAVEAVDTTGRAILIGGAALITADLVAAAVGPTKVLTSLFFTATTCALLAAGAAVIVAPAALSLFGDRVRAWSFPAPRFAERAWGTLSGGGSGFVVRDAVVVGALATAFLAVLAIPLLSLDTGPPSPKYLPSDNSARLAYERVETAMGAGTASPYNIVVVSNDKPLTDEKLVNQLSRFQDQLAKDPRVRQVVGPGVFAATSEELGVLPKTLRDSTKLLKSGKKDLGTLESGLGQAGAGVLQLQSGLQDAATGAGKLQSGSGSAQSGAGQLRAGLDQAKSGASQISSGLDQALTGARKLQAGSAAALTGSQKISGGLGQAVEPVKTGAPIVKQMAADVSASSAAVKDAAGQAQTLNGQLDAAAASVQSLPASPERTAALNDIAAAKQSAAGLQSTLSATDQKLSGASGIATAFAGQVAELSSGLGQLYAGSTALTKGIGDLKAGNAELANGIAKLSSGGGQLNTGVSALRDGASQLESGLGQLTGGAGQLASGLTAGIGPSGTLAAGLREGGKKVGDLASTLPSTKDLERLQKESPGLFDNGYFVLAAIQGAPASQRNVASFAVNLERGGNAGMITLTPRFSADDPKAQQLGEDLQKRVDAFAKVSGTEVALGGPAGSLGDFKSEAASRIWPVVIAVAVIIALMLMAFMRAIAVPAAVVLLDMLTAAAALGVMTVLFSGDDPVLGGPGYLDPMSIIAVFVGLFNITIIYTVQLLSRTREAFLATGDPKTAVRSALTQTAGASTGAMLAMLAVVIPFAFSDLVLAQQLPIGIAIVLLLNMLVVRPVLMPAAIEVLGRFGWWPTSKKAPHPPAAEAEPVETVPAAPAIGATS